MDYYRRYRVHTIHGGEIVCEDFTQACQVADSVDGPAIVTGWNPHYSDDILDDRYGHPRWCMCDRCQL